MPRADGDRGPRAVVMGVSGSGKSTVGAILARRLGLPFVDADDLHPPRNVSLMRAGIPLTDADRWPWLDAVGARLAAGPCVVACSALRRTYRDRLRRACPEAVFVFLSGERGLIAGRQAARSGHFMPATLLDSQFETLEPPASDEPAVPVDVSETPNSIAAAAAAALWQRGGRPGDQPGDQRDRRRTTEERNRNAH